MASDPMLSGSDAQLMELVRAELTNVPIEHWGFFFPCHVAVWRFIEAARPGALGHLKARFKDEPLFEGKGANWFCEELGSTEEYVRLLEAIMYPITRDAPTTVREAVKRRGFFHDDEIPPIDEETVNRLAAVVLRSVDDAVRDGRIT